MQQAVEWLSSWLSSSPVYMKQIVNGFQLDPFPRTFNNEKGDIVLAKIDGNWKIVIYMSYVACSSVIIQSGFYPFFSDD